MGCNTAGGICGTEDKPPEPVKLRRVKTMTYSSIQQNNTLNKKLDESNDMTTVGLKESKKDKHIEKAIHIDKTNYCSPNVELNNSFDKPKTDDRSKEVEVKESAIQIEIRDKSNQSSYKDPKEKLLELGYELELDCEEQECREVGIVKQLVIPSNKDSDKLFKQSTGDGEAMVAKGRSSM